MSTEGSEQTILAPEVSAPLFDVGDPFAPAERDLKPSYKFNAENAVTLLVGPDKHGMVVHASYLARTSEFFASALKKEWVEGQTRTIELDEEAPDIIYQGTLPGSPARRLMVDLSLRSGCPKCYTADDLDKAFLVDLTQAFFTAVHGPKSVEEQRRLVPEPKDYRV